MIYKVYEDGSSKIYENSVKKIYEGLTIIPIWPIPSFGGIPYNEVISSDYNEVEEERIIMTVISNFLSHISKKKFENSFNLDIKNVYK